MDIISNITGKTLTFVGDLTMLVFREYLWILVGVLVGLGPTYLAKIGRNTHTSNALGGFSGKGLKKPIRALFQGITSGIVCLISIYFGASLGQRIIICLAFNFSVRLII